MRRVKVSVCTEAVPWRGKNFKNGLKQDLKAPEIKSNQHVFETLLGMCAVCLVDWSDVWLKNFMTWIIKETIIEFGVQICAQSITMVQTEWKLLWNGVKIPPDIIPIWHRFHQIHRFRDLNSFFRWIFHKVFNFIKTFWLNFIRKINENRTHDCHKKIGQSLKLS